jgi:DNA-binding response OmpR family regulator
MEHLSSEPMNTVVEKAALLIQSDTLAAAALAESFETVGFGSVRVAATLEMAEVLLRSWTPDIVVVGPEMVEGDVQQVLTAAVGMENNQLVVVTSGYGDKADPKLQGWGFGGLGRPLSSMDLAVRAAFAVVSKSIAHIPHSLMLH